MSSSAVLPLPNASKTAGEENFPVGSWLLPAATRQSVMAFYNFARAADDIADSPDLTGEQKLATLGMMEAGLRGEARAGSELGLALRAALFDGPADTTAAQDLLEAFKRDALRNTCWSWQDLLTYCRFSAVPVGRFLLALHAEDDSGYEASDALCTALQILNHVQDCREDYQRLRRIYLPVSWFQAAGLGPDILEQDQSSPELRAILDRTLDGVDELLVVAHSLPNHLRNRRLRLEASVILSIADHLSAQLRTHDPLCAHVRLSRLQEMLCVAQGLFQGFGFR